MPAIERGGSPMKKDTLKKNKKSRNSAAERDDWFDTLMTTQSTDANTGAGVRKRRIAPEPAAEEYFDEFPAAGEQEYPEEQDGAQQIPYYEENTAEPAGYYEEEIPADEAASDYEEYEQPAPKAGSSFEYRDRGLFGYVSKFVFAVFSLLVISIAIFAIHPGAVSAVNETKSLVLRMGDNLDVFMNNAASDALSDIAYIKKIFVIPESATVAPKPDENGFGTTTDPQKIMEVIDKASELLDGQEMIFNPNLDFVPGSKMRWYYDETILVITWQEYIETRCCTCAEVKIAHGSQLRRKLADDTYGSSVQLYASDMAKASNAVVAVNGDFYAFRELGITVYQRNLYRNAPETVDTCYFTSSGDMIFSRAGELTKKGEAEKFIKDNDVVFSAAFGPILIDNGEVQKCASYPIGEINSEYSRSCIALKDTLHYFMMTINHTGDARPRATINQLAEYVSTKNVKKAYTLDGGQTSEIVMMGGPINNVDFGNERVVSDIIYFATALPEEG